MARLSIQAMASSKGSCLLHGTHTIALFFWECQWVMELWIGNYGLLGKSVTIIYTSGVATLKEVGALPGSC